MKLPLLEYDLKHSPEETEKGILELINELTALKLVPNKTDLDAFQGKAKTRLSSLFVKNYSYEFQSIINAHNFSLSQKRYSPALSDPFGQSGYYDENTDDKENLIKLIDKLMNFLKSSVLDNIPYMLMYVPEKKEPRQQSQKNYFNGPVNTNSLEINSFETNRIQPGDISELLQAFKNQNISDEVIQKFPKDQTNQLFSWIKSLGTTVSTQTLTALTSLILSYLGLPLSK